MALVFVSAACVPALAAGKYTAYISGTGKASAGGTVECEIVMTDVAIFGGILAFSAAVGYDEDVLEFDSASSSASGVPEGWLTDIGKSVKEKGMVIVSLSADTSEAFDRPLGNVSVLSVKIVFKVKNAAVNSTEIRISDTEAVDYAINGVTGTCTSMTVTLDGASATTTETSAVQTTSTENPVSESTSTSEKQYDSETTEAKKTPLDKSGKRGIIIAAIAVAAVVVLLAFALGMKKKR